MATRHRHRKQKNLRKRHSVKLRKRHSVKLRKRQKGGNIEEKALGNERGFYLLAGNVMKAAVRGSGLPKNRDIYIKPIVSNKSLKSITLAWTELNNTNKLGDFIIVLDTPLNNINLLHASDILLAKSNNKRFYSSKGSMETFTDNKNHTLTFISNDDYYTKTLDHKILDILNYMVENKVPNNG